MDRPCPCHRDAGRAHAQPRRVALAAVISTAILISAGFVAVDAGGVAPSPGRSVWSDFTKFSGSPEPPTPYRVVPAFPNLRVKQPVAVAKEPGRDSLLLSHHLRPWLGGEWPSQLVRIVNDPSTAAIDPLLVLSDRMIYDFAFHPDYEDNGYVFVATGGVGADGSPRMRVSRFTVSSEVPHRIDPGSELEIISWPSVGHNGGGLVFGPDGLLFVSAGDGSNDSDAEVVGQDLGDLRATIMRIDVDHPGDGLEYSIPEGNPFVNLPGARPEIWAYGLRNPWRLSFDAESGQLWVGDVGQDRIEMIHLVKPGANYGWSVYEGTNPFRLSRELGPTPVSPPTVEHPHSEARSVTGGLVYRGQRFKELRGAYLYGDYETGRIWAVRHDGEKVLWHRELADTTIHITGFAETPSGDILVLDHESGAIYRLEPRTAVVASAEFPKRLSQTGLFTSVAKHQVHPALIPYSVNAPQWLDGARAIRFIALPGAARVAYKDTGAWEFPDGTVLVQTIFLEGPPGSDDVGIRVETRLLVFQRGEWSAYSYMWNQAQTEATLVPKQGGARRFRIPDPAVPGGQMEETWVYPSRGECLICHNRNPVLGIQTAQLNRASDGAQKGNNQLTALLLAGVFERPKKKAERRVFGKLRRPDLLPRLADPYDEGEDLGKRARSYLHANCAGCHQRESGGNSSMDLAFDTGVGDMLVFDVTPQHQTFDLEDPRIISPGNPGRSVMWRRIVGRGDAQMPPLGAQRVDPAWVNLLFEWISSLDAVEPEPEAPAPASLN